MPQAVFTINDAIVNALYLTGELGVGETPDAFMLTTGLELANELLTQWSSDSIYIPFLTTINFNFVPGQANYTISDIVPADINSDRFVDLSFANYQIPTTNAQPLNYPLRIISKAEYYNVIRQDNTRTRPVQIFFNKQPTQTIITVYPVPDQPYAATIQVKGMLDLLTQTDVLTQLPPFYYGLFKYALAQKYLNYYPSANWTPGAQAELEKYYAIMKNTNETDLTIRPSLLLSVPEPWYWQQIFTLQ